MPDLKTLTVNIYKHATHKKPVSIAPEKMPTYLRSSSSEVPDSIHYDWLPVYVP